MLRMPRVRTPGPERAPRPLHVLYDRNRELLVPALLGKRRPITEARLALNGYQKGHCFYCYQTILVVPNSPAPADVDHVFPYSLMSWGLQSTLTRSGTSYSHAQDATGALTARAPPFLPMSECGHLIWPHFGHLSSLKTVGPKHLTTLR